MPRVKNRITRHKLGQHFLVDDSVADRIIDASCVGNSDRVLEVGPGKGVLTRRLLTRGNITWAVELDKKLYTNLSSEFADNKNIRLFHCNALKFDYNSITPPYHVISNLPYSISVPLVKQFIEHNTFISSATIMVQDEVAKRICASPGESSYGSLSVFMSYHMDVEHLFTVSRSSFNPIPKVKSSVIRMVPLSKPRVQVDNASKFFSFVQTAFSHRRKTIKNNISPWWSDLRTFSLALKESDIDPMMRAQDISLEKYSKLFNLLNGQKTT